MRGDGVRHAEVHMANGSLLLGLILLRDQVLQLFGAFDVLNLPREEEAGLEDYQLNPVAHREQSLSRWRLASYIRATLDYAFSATLPAVAMPLRYSSHSICCGRR